jgi:hypothetical protein
VEVRLERGPSIGPWAAQLTIADDGSGFDPVAVSSGMGLANLRARAGELGAELRIDSAPGQGTRVCVRVPAGAARTTAASAGVQRGLLLGSPRCSTWGWWGGRSWAAGSSVPASPQRPPSG